MTDLFAPVKTKREQLFDFIRDRRWVKTSDIARYGTENFSNRAMRDARQLCQENKIFRMREDLKRLRFSGTVEDVYTIYENEKV